MHFHGSIVAENRPPLPGWAFSIASKNGRVLATGKIASALARRVRWLRVTGLSMSSDSAALRDDLVERPAGASRCDRPRAPRRRAGRPAPQRLPLALGDIELADRGHHELADVVNRIRDRRVGADERAFHASGAQIRDELRHVAAEQALVLEGRAAGRHEQARARHDRRFGDRAVAERRAHRPRRNIRRRGSRSRAGDRPTRHMPAEIATVALALACGRLLGLGELGLRHSRARGSPSGRRGSPPCCPRRPGRPWRRTSWRSAGGSC